MLKRIQSIQNIGRFKASSAGSAQFDKITLIFGRNTYGKSTLGDLLSSLELGDTSALTTRKTIPSDGKPQRAVLSFQLEGQGETPVRLDNNCWQPLLPAGLCLRVFDDGFYHNNVFAARQFTRSTKENFSSFVLGAQGVAKAQDIAEKNKQKGEATRERNKLQKAAFHDIDDLGNFLQLAPTESIMALKEKVDSLRREIDGLNNQRNNATTIKTRKELNMINWEVGFTDALERLNQALQTSLNTVHDEALRKVTEHIQGHFKETKNADAWIRQGLTQNKGDRCQFCGQALGEEALQLLEVYRQNFDTSYQEHETHITKEISESRLMLTKDRNSSLRIVIEGNSGALVSYPELDDNETYQTLRVDITELTNRLNEAIERWAQHYAEFNEHFEAILKQKLASPHVQLNGLHAETLLQLNDQLARLADQYNGVAEQINAITHTFKISAQDDSLNQKLDAIKRESLNEARKIRRLEMSEQCAEYIKLDSTVTNLAEAIPRLQEELRSEQSGYLNQFFERLNYYFKEFGSRDFSLVRGEDTSGHTPIYYLKVKYCNYDVSERDLERVFSESDRRALALAVFWAGLACLSEENKRNTIVVLDDPITSFDNHRMTAVHQEIVRMADEARQVIVLSHFEQGVANFLNTYRKNKPVQLLSIEREGGSSTLQAADIENFIRNEHQKARDNIFKFISEETNAHNAGDLRVFLEYEVTHRFARQISDNCINESNLSDRIDRLVDAGNILPQIGSELHGWREVLNPDHHTWMGNDIEDQRSTAARFMNFIYYNLVPVNTTT